MAGTLVRSEGIPSLLAGRNAALAVAAGKDSTHLWQHGELLVAIWGHAGFNDVRLAELARVQGMAKTLADDWREKGERSLECLTGAFSLCILDGDTDTAVLAIDRMGIHPLAFQIVGECLVFGSSADAINLHPLVKPEICPQGIYNYVYFHMIPGPGTIYREQRRLLPGEYLVYRNKHANIGRYWEMTFVEEERRPFETLRQEFLDVLHSSVRHAMDGHEVGAFLSGGTDSSTIAGILGKVGEQPARTYSIGFDASGYDEMEYARIAARHFSTRHKEYYVTPDDIVAAIPQVAGIFDQPFGNSSAVPAFYCARMAVDDGVTRMLGGDGGDELFGGNVRYAKQHLFSLYEQVPSVIRKGMVEPLLFGMPGGAALPLVRKARSYIEQASITMPARTETYNLLERYGHQTVFTPEFLSRVDPGDPADLLNRIYHQNEAASLINRMLAFDRKFTLADNDLPKVVKACELAGVDVAFPLISDEITAFSLRLEPRLKLKGTQLRYFFKEALRGFLPDEIIAKQKHGFGLPFGVWLRHHPPLQALARESLNGLKARAIVQPEFIDRLLGQHLDEHASYHGTMVWILMMLEQWYRQHTSR